MEVKLLTSPHAIKEMENNSALATLTCHANTNKAFVPSEVLKRIIKNGHESILEHITMAFSIHNLSRACLQELARHRHISLSVESTRHTLHKYLTMSDDEICAFFEEYLKTLPIASVEPKQKKMFCGTYLGILRGVKDIPNDELKYFLPELWPTNLVLTSNARELRHILKLRTTPQALKEFRILSHSLYETVPEEFRYLFEDCVCTC